MNLFESSWVQAGELGFAFVVLILCAGMVIYVLKTSAAREKNYLDLITKFLPMMEGISNGIESINTIGPY